MREPGAHRGHARIVLELRPAERLEEPLEHAVVGAGDRYPPPVAAPIVVVGHRALGAGADALAHVAARAVHRNRVVEDAEHPLIEPEGHHMALPPAPPRAERPD